MVTRPFLYGSRPFLWSPWQVHTRRLVRSVCLVPSHEVGIVCVASRVFVRCLVVPAGAASRLSENLLILSAVGSRLIPWHVGGDAQTLRCSYNGAFNNTERGNTRLCCSFYERCACIAVF